MKKVKSPPKEQDVSASLRTNLKKELLKPYRPINSLFTTAEEERKKKDASSIRKVLKELTDLKKELREIKTATRTNSQGLDMSLCRKMAGQKKSPCSPSQQKNGSHSSSRNKSNSKKREISTQTKLQHRQVNEFSFSVDSKSGQKYQKLIHESSEEEQSDQEPRRKQSQLSTKRRPKTGKESHKELVFDNMTDRVNAIETSELYEKHLNNLKHNIDTLQISSPLLSSDDKLRLNIEVERMSKNVCRIPIYMGKSQQYYENIKLYARTLSNQLNNFVLLLNKSQGTLDRNQENRQNTLNKSQEKVCQRCQNCIENERKTMEKAFKKELKRYQKEISKLEEKLENKREEAVKTSHMVASLLKDQEVIKQELRKAEEQALDWQTKYFETKKGQEEAQVRVVEVQEERVKQIKKVTELQLDLKYYKDELQKVRNRAYQCSQQKESSYQQRNKELEMIVLQIRGKEALYQTMLKEKDCLIHQLKEQLQSRRRTPVKSPSKTKKAQVEESENESIDSADYYRQQSELRQKEQLCAAQSSEIQYLKETKTATDLKYKEVLNNLQLCMEEIEKLHQEIDHLHQVNDKYKDKCLKTKIISEKKGKREVEAKQKKSQAFAEINDIIKHHRDALARDKQ